MSERDPTESSDVQPSVRPDLAPLVLEPPSLPPPAPKVEWTDEQSVALDAIDDWRESERPFFSLTGPAGSGKSTMVREIVDRYPYAVLTAMTGKAALRLSHCAGREAGTLHSTLYYPPKPGEELRFSRLREPPADLIVVDEASMITPAVYAHMKVWAKSGVSFLLVGDGYQLPPVITGEELKENGEDYSVFQIVRGAELETVMRSVGGVLRAATKVRQTGEICRESDEGYTYAVEREPMARAVEEYLADRDDHLIITWRNALRMAANRTIRARLGHEGPLPDEGEPVLIKRNGQGFLNGEIVTCGGFETGPQLGSMLTMWMRTGYTRILVSFEGGREDRGGEFFDGQQPWVESWQRYHIDLKKQNLPEPLPITYGYCHTAHSAQGSEARRVTVFLERGDERSRHFRKPTTLPSGAEVPFSARFIYTATTRGKKQAMMIVGR